MRVIKIGDKYLGLVDSRKDAIRIHTDDNGVQARQIAASVAWDARVVKVKTRADQTGDSMRGLATDILEDQ